MADAPVGRDVLLEQAWTGLRSPGIVLLEGPAGIGKTSVLQALVERARSDGIAVVGCAPAETETRLPLAALADLLRPLAAEIDELPDRQRDALRTVLLTAAGPAAVDERALAVATLTLLQGLAGRGAPGPSGAGAPAAVIAIDDAPWLDPPSERALRFALRRLPRSVAVLVSCRTDEPGVAEAPLGLGRLERLTRHAVTPLRVGPLHHLLARQFGVSLSRPMVSRLARDCGGNPLLAIELTRSILRLPRLPSAGEDLPVPASMQELVGASLRVLPPAGQRAVRLAALLSAPDLADLARADVAAHDLDAAEEVGLVTVTANDRVRFGHPVHAGAVRAGIPPGIRRRLHARLARVCLDADERARHLARSTTSPDAQVAADLAAAGARTLARGAPELAADFYERAAQLTPELQDRYPLRLAEIQCRYDSGDYTDAGRLADTLATTLTGDELAETLLLRAAIAFSADDIGVALAAGGRALATATFGSRLAGRIHAHLSVFVDLPGPAREHAQAALALLADRARDATADGGPTDTGPTDTQDACRDRPLRASALMLLFLNDVRSGEPARVELLEQALELEAGEPLWLAGTVPAIWWKGVDEHEQARQRLEWMLGLATASGHEPMQHELVAHLGELETLAGRYDAAAAWIGRARELGEQLATGLAAETWLAGMLDAHVGDLEAAAAAATHGLERAERSGEPWARRINLQLAAFTALAAGRPSVAARHYAQLAQAVDATGLVEPLSTRFEADWVQACAAAGDLATARLALDRLEQRHARLPRPWTALGLACGRVLLAASAGQDTAALIDALIAEREAVPAGVVPFDRARCLLVAGLAHRRARRKRASRDALLAAAGEFDVLGAPGFAERARAEAARTGGRPTSASELTSTEARVAGLAAAGHTNRAIAEALYISPKTVEANLARVYRKLGIASRAQLGTAMTEQRAG